MEMEIHKLPGNNPISVSMECLHLSFTIKTLYSLKHFEGLCVKASTCVVLCSCLVFKRESDTPYHSSDINIAIQSVHGHVRIKSYGEKKRRELSFIKKKM